MSSTILMRLINGFLCLVLVAFAAVQYNDPDVYLWMPLYAAAAAWAGTAAYRPGKLRRRPLAVLLTLCIVAAVAASVWYWPTEEGFWHREVWWESETAREGMGVMVVTVALIVAAFTAARAKIRD
jgi:hypothetical protein